MYNCENYSSVQHFPQKKKKSSVQHYLAISNLACYKCARCIVFV